MREHWLRDFFRALEELDPDELLPYFDETACLRLGEGSPVVGKVDIRRAIVRFFETLRGMHYEHVGFWITEGSAVLEAEVTYTRRDGSTVTLPTASILRFEHRQVTDYHVLSEPAQLQAA
jgi:hypothetical protein